MKLTPQNVKHFQEKIWDFYKEHKRDFPWRETHDPYLILVSEIMLQQTQTSRVLPKYEAFIKHFPTLQKLSKASRTQILEHWSGLGYNRRALYLKNIAERIVKDFQEIFPLDTDVLVSFPGIGPNTAGSIFVFSTNKPFVFIETNIRRVFIHEFFKDTEKITDTEILRLIEKTLDQKSPRDWYYALMDYGAHIAKTETNPNRKSKHYAKQSTFDGSIRQARGKILKILLFKKSLDIEDLKREVDSQWFEKAFKQLEKEGFLTIQNNKIALRN